MIHHSLHQMIAGVMISQNVYYVMYVCVVMYVLYMVSTQLMRSSQNATDISKWREIVTPLTPNKPMRWRTRC